MKKRLDDDDDDDPQCIGIGFSSSSVKKLEGHEHSFRQVEPFRAYRKRGEKRFAFVTLFCECGITTEILAEDKRPLTKDERKQLGC